MSKIYVVVKQCDYDYDGIDAKNILATTSKEKAEAKKKELGDRDLIIEKAHKEFKDDREKALKAYQLPPAPVLWGREKWDMMFEDTRAKLKTSAEVKTTELMAKFGLSADEVIYGCTSTYLIEEFDDE
jgi:hypothetical protein